MSLSYHYYPEFHDYHRLGLELYHYYLMYTTPNSNKDVTLFTSQISKRELLFVLERHDLKKEKKKKRRGDPTPEQWGTGKVGMCTC